MAALGGMAVPVAIFLAFNAGHGSARRAGAWRCRPTPPSRWGMLALSGAACPIACARFMLTVMVVDDLVALMVIAVAYSADDRPSRRCWSRPGVRSRPGRERRSGFGRALYSSLAWSPGGRCSSPASTRSCSASRSASSPGPTRPARSELERATHMFRRFREQPTPELARSAGRPAGRASPRTPVYQALPPVDELRDRAAVRARQRRASRSTATFSRARFRRRSRSGSSAATCSASLWGSPAPRWLVTKLSRGRLARRSAGRRPWAAARSPGSASRSRC